jgi:hypothetical protein
MVTGRRAGKDALFVREQVAHIRLCSTPTCDDLTSDLDVFLPSHEHENITLRTLREREMDL